jgi:hypothetical protein
MKTLISILITLALAATASAQITLTQANVPPIGTQYSSFSTQDEVTFDPGAGGANQNWDIEMFDYQFVGSGGYVSPAQTPFAGDFPTATHATEAESIYSYMRSAANGFYNLGYGVQDPDTTYTEIYDPEMLLIPFPCTMNTNWTDVFRMEFEIVPGFVMTTVDSTVHQIDGWGNLTVPTPVLETFPVLRDQEHSYNYALLNGMPQGETTEYWSYRWYGQSGFNGGGFSATVDGTGPNFTTGWLDFTIDGGSSTDPVRGPIAESFKVEQNYPNPFNPSTTLPVELAHATNVSVTIYNEMGQVVEKFEQSLGAGRHELPIDGSSWSSGSYFATVMADHEIQTTKMVLVK